MLWLAKNYTEDEDEFIQRIIMSMFLHKREDKEDHLFPPSTEKLWTELL